MIKYKITRFKTNCDGELFFKIECGFVGIATKLRMYTMTVVVIPVFFKLSAQVTGIPKEYVT